MNVVEFSVPCKVFNFCQCGTSLDGCQKGNDD